MPEKKNRNNSAGMGKRLLIPVDFTKRGLLACRFGFDFARRLDLPVTLLHSFVGPQYNPTLNYMPGFVEGGEDVSQIMDIQAMAVSEEEAHKMMAGFEDELKKKIAAGELPDVEFETQVVEGVPEICIKEYVAEIPTGLVVMATRDLAKKGSEVLGSVAAEVIDNCTVPVFTVPDDSQFTNAEQITRCAFFCNVEKQDTDSFRFLMDLFDSPEIEVYLIPVSNLSDASVRDKMQVFCASVKSDYPNCKFSTHIFSRGNFREALENFVTTTGIQLIIVPNKKTNIFTRIFNPSLPHRVLFEADIPMLALPV